MFYVKEKKRNKKHERKKAVALFKFYTQLERPRSFFKIQILDLDIIKTKTTVLY